MKTVDELLKTRYKVIADYPLAMLSVGDIIEFENGIYGNQIVHGGTTSINNEGWIKRYPHLFKKLEWWEERSGFDDFPKYVKLEIVEGKLSFVHKVYEWTGYNSNGQPIYSYINKANHLSPFCAKELLPATESEYTTYISQTKT